MSKTKSTPATIRRAAPNEDASRETSSRPTTQIAESIYSASGAPISRPARREAKSTLRPPGGTDIPATIDAAASEVGASQGTGASGPATRGETETIEVSLLDPALAFAADILDDIEDVRKANENRLRQMTRSTEDKDGHVRGLGYDESHPDVAWMASLVEMIGKAEHQAELNLERQLRRHAMYPWIKERWSGGRKQIARLLAAIGDPYIRPEWTKADGTVVPEGPRTVSALRAYCGLHVLPVGHSAPGAHGFGADRNQLPDGHMLDGRHTGIAVGDKQRDVGHDLVGIQVGDAGVAPKRQRNQQSNWNETARMRAWNVADKAKQAGFDSVNCVSMTASETGFAIHSERCQCKPYRLVYDAARAKYAEAVHASPCVRCGPKSKPAAIGSPLSDAHKNARAVRIVMKEILKDLWREAKRLHELHDGAGHVMSDAQFPSVGAVVPNPPVGHGMPVAQSGYADRTELPGGHMRGDDHPQSAVGDQHRDTDQGDSADQFATVGVAAPNEVAPGRQQHEQTRRTGRHDRRVAERTRRVPA